MVKKWLLDNDPYYPVSKKLILKLGLKTALFLSNLIEAEAITGRQEVYQTENTVKKHTGLSSHDQKTAIKILLEHNLITKKAKGLPRKRYFIIQQENLKKFLDISDPIPENKQEDKPEDNELIEKVTKLYDLYPRKQNKKAGIKKAIQLIKEDKTTLKELETCINNYSKSVKNKDKKYIKLFNNFLEDEYYMDYLNVEKEEEEYTWVKTPDGEMVKMRGKL